MIRFFASSNRPYRAFKPNKVRKANETHRRPTHVQQQPPPASLPPTHGIDQAAVYHALVRATSPEHPRDSFVAFLSLVNARVPKAQLVQRTLHACSRADMALVLASATATLSLDDVDVSLWAKVHDRCLVKAARLGEAIEVLRLVVTTRGGGWLDDGAAAGIASVRPNVAVYAAIIEGLATVQLSEQSVTASILAAVAPASLARRKETLVRDALLAAAEAGTSPTPDLRHALVAALHSLSTPKTPVAATFSRADSLLAAHWDADAVSPATRVNGETVRLAHRLARTDADMAFAASLSYSLPVDVRTSGVVAGSAISRYLHLGDTRSAAQLLVTSPPRRLGPFVWSGLTILAAQQADKGCEDASHLVASLWHAGTQSAGFTPSHSLCRWLLRSQGPTSVARLFSAWDDVIAILAERRVKLRPRLFVELSRQVDRTGGGGVAELQRRADLLLQPPLAGALSLSPADQLKISEVVHRAQ